MIISEWNHSNQEKTEILDLAMKAFGECELSNPDYFDWQYLQNPDGKAIIILVKDPVTKAIIGMNAFLPMTFIFNKQLLQCYLSCNSIIHPDYRNKGIFTELVSKIPEIFSKKQFSFIYGIPNSNSTKIFSKNKFSEIAKIPILIKPLQLSSYFPSPLSKIIKPFDFFWKPSFSFNNEIKLLENNIDDQFEDLIKKSSKNFSLFHFKSKEFLQWRYMNHPTRNYQIFTLNDNSKLIGYIITREMNIYSKKLGIIVDFSIDPDYAHTIDFQNFIKKILHNFWKNKVTLVISTSKIGNLENQILKNSRFFKAPSFLKQEKLPLIVLSLTNTGDFKNFDKWSFVLGDYDVF